MTFDTRAFRNILGCFTTGVVAVCTEKENGDRYGITINSFTSVSLDPPLVLFCLARTTDSLTAILEHKIFSVNILAADQQGLSNQLAKKGGPAKMEGVAVKHGKSGAPFLEGSIAFLECRLSEAHEGGDHIICLGEVLDFTWGERKEPLIYYGGAYRHLQALLD